MPRRNRRRPQGDPASFAKLAATLHDEWARQHGRLTRSDREHRDRQARHRAQQAAANPDRPVSLDDARAKLAALLGR